MDRIAPSQAEQGHNISQTALGSFYEAGSGVLQDNVMAHMWFNIAAANSSEKAIGIRDNLAKNMTSVDISKAQSMARKCMDSNYEECGC